jgi:hypothetical protein
MAKALIPIILLTLILSPNAISCETKKSKESAIDQLYSNEEFKKFICGEKPCKKGKLEMKIDFHIRKITSHPFILCFAEQNFNVKNRYTGILTFDKNKSKLHLILYNTDIEVRSAKETLLIANLATDNHDETTSSYSYTWNGHTFR